MATLRDQEASQHDLEAAAIRGDPGAFREVYEQLAGRVYNLVLRSVREPATAEDICQEVWLKAHRDIRTLQTPAALRTWLFRIASRACIDYTRSRAFRERSCPEVPEQILDTASVDPEEAAIRRHELREMWETLAAMPPRQSMALYLRQVEGMSYEDIGRVLGCPRTAVETLLFRARQGFKRARGRLQDDPSSSCRLITQTMAVVLDKEGTPLQVRAVQSHVESCKACRAQLVEMRRAIKGYGWLPLLPAGQQALNAALTGSAGGAGIGLQFGRLLELLLLKAKAGATAGLVAGAVGVTAAAAGTVAGVTPSPLEVVGFAREKTGSAASGVQPKEDAVAVMRDEDAAPSAPFGGSEPDAIVAEGPESLAATTPSQPGAASSDGQSAQPPELTLPSLAEDGTLPDGTSQAGLVSGLAETTTATLEGLTTTVGNLVENTTGLLGTTVDDLTKTLAGGLSDPLGTLQDPGGTIDNVTATAGNALGGTTTTTNQAVDDTTDVVDTLTGGQLEGVTGTVDETTEDLTTTVNNTLQDTLNGVGGALGGLLGKK